MPLYTMIVFLFHIQGYNMFHVLEKWSNLYFLSHIIAALSYVFSLVV